MWAAGVGRKESEHSRKSRLFSTFSTRPVSPKTGPAVDEREVGAGSGSGNGNGNGGGGGFYRAPVGPDDVGQLRELPGSPVEREK